MRLLIPRRARRHSLIWAFVAPKCCRCAANILSGQDANFFDTMKSGPHRYLCRQELSAAAKKKLKKKSKKVCICVVPRGML